MERRYILRFYFIKLPWAKGIDAVANALYKIFSLANPIFERFGYKLLKVNVHPDNANPNLVDLDFIIVKIKSPQVGIIVVAVLAAIGAILFALGYAFHGYALIEQSSAQVKEAETSKKIVDEANKLLENGKITPEEYASIVKSIAKYPTPIEVKKPSPTDIINAISNLMIIAVISFIIIKFVLPILKSYIGR